MKYKPYPKYKDSGVEWLGEIPEGWDIAPLKRFYGLQDRPVNDDDEIVTAFRDGKVTLRRNRREDGFTNALQEIGYQGVRKGDLVIHAMDAFAGAIGVSDSDGKSTPVYSVCKAKDDLCTFTLFHGYLLRSMAVSGYVAALAKGIRERSTDFRWAEAGRTLVVLPPLPTQKAIASFLDIETIRIDGLIKNYEDLIALLQEKRQALISHAVTRGLSELVEPDDPEFGEWAKPVKFVDSGVEWLGEIPEGWRASPLKFIARIGNGSTPNRENSEYWSEDGFPWLNSSVVNLMEVTEAVQFVTEKALAECHLPIIDPPAVLVGITGQGKTRGMAAPLAFKATINQHVAYIKPDEDTIIVGFLLRILEAAYEQLRFDSEGVGSTKGAITCEQLGKFYIPLPSDTEQQAIASFLDRETSKLDSLVAEAEGAIELLKERRSALITAAVTGKINVEG